MKVRLIGCGAVGAPLSVRLKDKCDFALISDEEHRASLMSDGITVNGVQYHFPIDTALKSDIDLIIISVKNFALKDTVETITPYVGRNTILLSLLNGVDSEEILEKAFPYAHVLYGFITSLSSNRSGSTINCFSQSGGVIFLGEKDGRESDELLLVQALFDNAGVSYRIPEDIRHEIWWKFMLNTAFNSLSGVLGTPYNKISGNEAMLRAARMVAAEVRSAAETRGIVLTGDDVQRMIETLTALTDSGKTSMLQDIEAGRRTENRYFAGSVSRICHENGIPSPICDFLFNLVEAASYAAK